MGSQNHDTPRTVRVTAIVSEKLIPSDLSRYLMSLLIKRIFMLKCTLPMLRFTTALVSLALPLVLTHLLCYHKRIRSPPSFLSPTFESIVLSAFPIAWFYGFLYYTEVPSLVLVASTVVAASHDRHWLAGLVRFLSKVHLRGESHARIIHITAGSR
jgi:hypothetical protein